MDGVSERTGLSHARNRETRNYQIAEVHNVYGLPLPDQTNLRLSSFSAVPPSHVALHCQGRIMLPRALLAKHITKRKMGKSTPAFLRRQSSEYLCVSPPRSGPVTRMCLLTAGWCVSAGGQGVCVHEQLPVVHGSSCAGCNVQLAVVLGQRHLLLGCRDGIDDDYLWTD